MIDANKVAFELGNGLRHSYIDNLILAIFFYETIITSLNYSFWDYEIILHFFFALKNYVYILIYLIKSRKCLILNKIIHISSNYEKKTKMADHIFEMERLALFCDFSFIKIVLKSSYICWMPQSTSKVIRDFERINQSIYIITFFLKCFTEHEYHLWIDYDNLMRKKM